MAFNGTGSNVTSLNASNIASGTLAVGRGGTGTASPSLVGGTNITISGSWPNQTVTAAGGGVTSLNGQTGAITNTDVNSIGSYIFAQTNSAIVLYGTRAASGIGYQDNFGDYRPFPSISGTWRCLGTGGMQASGPTNPGTGYYGIWSRVA